MRSSESHYKNLKSITSLRIVNQPSEISDSECLDETSSSDLRMMYKKFRNDKFHYLKEKKVQILKQNKGISPTISGNKYRQISMDVYGGIRPAVGPG